MKYEYRVITSDKQGKKDLHEVLAENFTQALELVEILENHHVVSVIRKSGGILETDIH